MHYAPRKRHYNNYRNRNKSSANFDNFNTSKIATRNRKTYDNYVNAISGFGGRYDPMTRLTYNLSDVLDRGTIETLYRQDWFSRKIIEIIPDDITRKWINVTMPEESLVREVNEKLKKLKAITKIKEALVNARLYGGSVIILGIFNGKSQNEPLDYSDIDDIYFLNVIDKTSLDVVSYYKDPFKANYGEPETYRLNTLLKPDDYDYNDSIIHESRLLRFDGAYLPERMRRTNNGWCDSVLNSMHQALKQYGTSIQAGALLFQDFISKTLKMPNLNDLLQSDEGIRALELRLQYAIANFSSLGIVLLGENEEFNKIQTPISGLPELIDKYIEIGAASSNCPRTRIFGQSLGTLAGATETTRAYYDYLRGYQIDHVQPSTYTLIKIILNCKTFSTQGKEPKEWGFEFNSLWDETTKEITTSRKMQGQTDDLYIKNKTLTPKEVRKNRFRKDGYCLETIINPESPDGEFYEEVNPMENLNNNPNEKIEKTTHKKSEEEEEKDINKLE